MDVCIISFSVLSNKLESMRLNIDRYLVKQLVSGQLPNNSRHLDDWHMSPRYGNVILVSGYPVLTAVNWPYCECQYKRCGFAKTRLRHPSLPFDSLPYPTRTICRRVRTYVRSVSHATTKRKEADHIPWVWGSVPRALRARGSPAIKDTDRAREIIVLPRTLKNLIFHPIFISSSYRG